MIYKYYQQYYKGVKVDGGGYLVTEKDETIIKFSPNVFSNLEITTIPIVSDEKIAVSLNTINIISKELLISHRFGKTPKLIWKVEYIDSELSTAFVDALNGKVIEKYSSKVSLSATTRNYQTVNLNTFFENGISSLKSHDNRIRIYQNLNNMNYNWNESLIPTTTSLVTWDTSPAWILSKQALYATERVDSVYNTKLGVEFPEIRVGTILIDNAFAIPNSNADILLGTLDNNPNGANYALYDIIAHELGHILLFQYLEYQPDNPNATLHEGLADIYADYVENFIKVTGTDWIMGNDDEAIRQQNLRNHSELYCYDPSSTSRHIKSKAISHWFYAITNGIPDTSISISSIGSIDSTMLLTLEAVSRINDPQAGIYNFKYLTLQVAEELYGINTPKYNSVLNAWHRVCVTQQCPNNAPDLVITTNVDLDTLQYDGGNIIIENGGILKTQFDQVYLENDKFIKVKAGGRLNVFRSAFFTCDGDGVWQGVIAEPGSFVNMENFFIYNAKEAIRLNLPVTISKLNFVNILGNELSEVGVGFYGDLATTSALTLDDFGNISGCDVGILMDASKIRMEKANISNCFYGFKVDNNLISLKKSNFNNCNYPIHLIEASTNSILEDIIISGDFNTGIYSENSTALIINHCTIGSANHRGAIGIKSVSDAYITLYNNDIFAYYRGMSFSSSTFDLKESDIDLQSYSLGMGLWTVNCGTSVALNNTITTNSARPSAVSFLNDGLVFENNEINHSASGDDVNAIRVQGSHLGSISQNIININGNSTSSAISLTNSTDHTMGCNNISSDGKGIDIQHNADLHNIRANYIDAATDLQTRSVLGEQSHQGNEFVGGTAEAIGLDFDEIQRSQFKVDTSFTNHLPTNPNPSNGWFISETNPKPENCNGLIIGPSLKGDICEYWKKLKKLKDTQPNRFFINLYHLLYRAKKDTSFRLPNCIKFDPLLAQLCGVVKIADVFAVVTKPTIDPVQIAPLRQLSQQYAIATDEVKKDELMGLMHIEALHLDNLKLIADSQDSLRMDSLRTELNLIHCDSIIIQKWKDILTLYTKFKQVDSISIADRSAVVAYSMHCADMYGDAIYLARVMAQTFTNHDFDQYDDCIATPPALPKVASTALSPESEIKISPNPTLGMVSIDFSDRFSGVCKVMDITGNLILTNTYLNTDQIVLDLLGNPGMNLVQFTRENGTSRIFKILVIK